LLGISAPAPALASVGKMGAIIGTPPTAIAVHFLESERLGFDFVQLML